MDGTITMGPAGAGVLAQSQQMATSAKQLLASAQSGGFSFQPEAADIMIKALQDSIIELSSLKEQLIIVSLAPKLGRTPAAERVSPLTRQVATDDRGIVRAVSNLRQVLTDMILACQRARQNYEDTDEAAAKLHLIAARVAPGQAGKSVP
jgi:hypothetical protein